MKTFEVDFIDWYDDDDEFEDVELAFWLIEWYWKSNIVKNDGEIYSEEEVIDFE